MQTVEKGKAVLRARPTACRASRPASAAGALVRGDASSPRPPAPACVARFASGAPAAVASSFGKGKALMLGSYVSAAYVSEPAEATRASTRGFSTGRV